MIRFARFAGLGLVVAGVLTFFTAFGASNADAGGFRCFIDSVAGFEDRVHVLCSNPVVDPTTGATIRFFAVPTSDPGGAATVSILGALGRKGRMSIAITFNDGDTSGEAFGCLASDCRRIINIFI